MPYFNSRRGPSAFGRGTRSGGSSYSKPSRGPKKAYIHPSKFVKKAEIVEQDMYVPSHTFNDFLVADVIKSNLIAKGFDTPTPIQDQTIPLGLAGNDIVGIANTGTGKTIAFAIPLLNQLIDSSDKKALIMAPTRELAQQIEDECRMIARGSGITGALLIGGSPMGPQLRDLRGNPRIVIGTPGRIKDHMERGTLDLTRFNIVVLDEVDRMLDMGFINDMRSILKILATPRQSFFFSATMDSKVKTLIDTFVHEPITISVKTGETSANVDQNVVGYRDHSEKIEKLHEILIHDDSKKVLVFDETKRSVEKLHIELEKRGFKADSLHGGKNQGQRARALSRFKKSEVNILVATDVAARGLDVSDITHVVNYTTPNSYEDYVHRVGRAGRAGKKGFALTFVEI